MKAVITIEDGDKKGEYNFGVECDPAFRLKDLLTGKKKPTATEELVIAILGLVGTPDSIIADGKVIR